MGVPGLIAHMTRYFFYHLWIKKDDKYRCGIENYHYLCHDNLFFNNI